jgi:hypothetical protein
MGAYSQKLTLEEYSKWVKKVKMFLISNGISNDALADSTGYSVKTVYDSLKRYERCSRFFVAAVNEWMEEYEKGN